MAAALATYAVCAAPVVLSGNATLLGYYVDTDPAFHLELTTWLLAHGHSLAGVPVYSPSAVTNMLHEYISSSYPLGADVAVGAVRPLAGQDLAWIYQPYMAVVMALTPLALGEVLRDAVPRRPMRALAAFIVATGGLIYAFYLQASVKEIVVILLLPAVVVLVVDLVRRAPVAEGGQSARRRRRRRTGGLFGGHRSLDRDPAGRLARRDRPALGAHGAARLVVGGRGVARGGGGRHRRLHPVRGGRIGLRHRRTGGAGPATARARQPCGAPLAVADARHLAQR